jgi:hypothetical protein
VIGGIPSPQPSPARGRGGYRGVPRNVFDNTNPCQALGAAICTWEYNGTVLIFGPPARRTNSGTPNIHNRGAAAVWWGDGPKRMIGVTG